MEFHRSRGWLLAGLMGHPSTSPTATRARGVRGRTNSPDRVVGVLAGGVPRVEQHAHRDHRHIQLLLDRLSGDEPRAATLPHPAQRPASRRAHASAAGLRPPAAPAAATRRPQRLRQGLALATQVGSRIEATLQLEEPLPASPRRPRPARRPPRHPASRRRHAELSGGARRRPTLRHRVDKHGGLERCGSSTPIPGAAAGPHVRVTIRDSRTGLDEATQSRLFEPLLARQRGVHGQFGLSLPAVYGIIAQHGGSVAVESEPHSGTTFMMYVPTVAGEGGPAIGAATPGSRGSEGYGNHPAHRAPTRTCGSSCGTFSSHTATG